MEKKKKREIKFKPVMKNMHNNNEGNPELTPVP